MESTAQERQGTRSSHVTPDRVRQIATGTWATAILRAGVVHKIFTLIEKGNTTPEEIAGAARISLRGARALVDGLAGLGLLERAGEGYRNAPDAAQFLVEGKPPYEGAFIEASAGAIAEWVQLPESVRTGKPVRENMAIPDDPFWEQLVVGIAPRAIPVAKAAAERLNIAAAASPAILDVGGGAGVFSAVWLSANSRATSTQVDWPRVNKIARSYTARFGVGERFTTKDGDLHEADFGVAQYDYIIYSNIAHGESPESNLDIFRRLRRALKDGGTLVISDFVLHDDRTGHPWALIFNSNMLLHSQEGASWREADYKEWLSSAGFKSIALQRLEPMPSTLIYAS